MTRQIERRLLALEAARPGGYEVVWGYDQATFEELPEAELARRVAEAKRRAGPNGMVLTVVYDHDWRPQDATN